METIQLLIEHKGVFTWNHEDMPNIDTEIIEHRLCVDLEAKKICQKRRTFNTKKYTAIAEEVKRLLAEGSLRKPIILSGFPTWS